MNTIQINFLRQRRKNLSSVQKTDKRYAMIIGYVTGAVVIATIALFGLNFYFNTQLETVEDGQRTQQRRITSQADVEVEYLTIAQKVSAIQDLIEGKTVKQNAIEFFTTLFAQHNTTLSELSFVDKGVIQFIVNTSTIFQMDELLVAVQSDQVRSLYPELTVTDVARAKTAEYTAAITVVLEKPKPTPRPRPDSNPVVGEEE